MWLALAVWLSGPLVHKVRVQFESCNPIPQHVSIVLNHKDKFYPLEVKGSSAEGPVPVDVYINKETIASLRFDLRRTFCRHLSESKDAFFVFSCNEKQAVNVKLEINADQLGVSYFRVVQPKARCGNNARGDEDCGCFEGRTLATSDEKIVGVWLKDERITLNFVNLDGGRTGFDTRNILLNAVEQPKQKLKGSEIRHKIVLQTMDRTRRFTPISIDIDRETLKTLKDITIEVDMK